jgi:hypothetical protein
VNKEIREIEKEHGSSTKMLYNAFSQRLQDISRRQGSLEQRLIGLMEQMPALENRYQEVLARYTQLIGEFNPEEAVEQVEESQVNKLKVTVITTQKAYESNYDAIMKDDKFNIDDERLKGNHKYDFQTLAESDVAEDHSESNTRGRRFSKRYRRAPEEHQPEDERDQRPQVEDHQRYLLKIEEVYTKYRDH